MVKGLFHPGSGLGNMLHRYVGTKTIALEKGEEHTMIGQEFFKGKDFMTLDLKPDDTKYTVEYPSGRLVPESFADVLDGEFQGELDFRFLDKVREWIKTDEYFTSPETCVINFRGGEYVGVPDLFLPKEYWDKAIQMMKDKGVLYFIVATDDEWTARKFFPSYPVISDIGENWRMIRYASNLILSNSSFAILPAYLNERVDKVICPKYWARYNTKEWLNPDNSTYSKFQYIHHEEN